VPSSRSKGAPVLPRWIADPAASDFAGPERLAIEGAGGLGWLKPFSRFLYALDLAYGTDRWPSNLSQPPRWPADWAPCRGRYDPATYEVLTDGPPEWLRGAVDAQQAEIDKLMRRAWGGPERE
jgi:hypothetical protein